MRDIISKVQQHHEQTLNRTTHDFKLKCLSNQTLQRLLNKSLKYEKQVLPQLDKNELKADFKKQATTKLCTVDVKHILSQQEWIEFFQQNKNKFRQ